MPISYQRDGRPVSEEGIETVWWNFVNSHPLHELIFRGQNSGPIALIYLHQKLEMVPWDKDAASAGAYTNGNKADEAFRDAAGFQVKRSLFGRTFISKLDSQPLIQSQKLRERVRAARLPKKVAFLGCRYGLRDQFQLKQILNLCAPSMEAFEIQCDLRPWTPWFLEALGKLDHAPSNLQTLDLSGVDLCQRVRGVGVAKYLCDLFANPSIPSLSKVTLSNCRFDCQAIELLGHGVRDGFGGLRTFSLNSCELGDKELKAFVDSLSSQHCNFLTRLSMTNNGFTRKSLPVLGCLLQKLTALEHLDLTGNTSLFKRSATPEEEESGVIVTADKLELDPFLEAVRTHACLKTLLLVGVGVGQISAAKLLCSLGRGTPKLETLRLEGNSLEDGDWMGALANVEGLRCLGLPSTLSLDFVLDVLERNCSLHELHYFWQSKVDIQNLLLRNRIVACQQSLPPALWPELISTIKRRYFLRGKRISIYDFVKDTHMFWAVLPQANQKNE